ncbi:Phytanoyl-CoA dioxygenase (PhyH) [Flavobacterium sp. ACN2]|uniref:phytanoyl-CoA dioxygenase family protein n=1 Tax=unclassified Flavobacterium TaxID=196869 RepID=UPI000BB31E37|nr:MULTISPECIES: phytanoyl-CoA dioxygenase family protein [unclassified Flavobacterium]MDY0986062.1 phytanoyl-CoA dioxygenase family protein [Flavobacterium sp. CFBP9031]PBI90808.1 Phytanoyl-CoA dioxygenase (PhyH) [Flavobacterium sp. ACN2]
MPWTVLEQLWKRTLDSKNANSDHTNWDNQIKTLYQLGIGMEDTLYFLYSEKPDFETFKTWINNRKRNTDQEIEDLTVNVLSKQDLEFWNRNGYVVVKNAISKEDCKATQKAIWEYLKMNPNEKESWYKRHEEQKGLMLNFSDHETLNRNRFSPRVKKAYEQLYGTTNIYKTIDKVSFNPPETDHFTFLGSPLHWDMSLKKPLTYGLQGLFYLTECRENDGAFHCVPGFHNQIDEWLDELEPHENPREKALKTLQPKPITGDAGDFIIWHNTLPHCATPNRGESPRMVQYLTYLPDDYNAAGEWI